MEKINKKELQTIFGGWSPSTLFIGFYWLSNEEVDKLKKAGYIVNNSLNLAPNGNQDTLLSVKDRNGNQAGDTFELGLKNILGPRT